jgi:hypothetical protein
MSVDHVLAEELTNEACRSENHNVMLSALPCHTQTVVMTIPGTPSRLELEKPLPLAQTRP